MAKILDQLNVLKVCREYRVGLWRCPHFLFIAMGVAIIGLMVVTYFSVQMFEASEEIVIGSVSLETMFFFVVAFIITKSFERLALANKMKSEFVSIASHQLRSPLSSVKWSLDLILSGRLGSLSKKQLEYLKMVKKNNERMMKLIGDLLNVSRIEEGKIKIKPQPVQLEEIVAEELKGMEPLTAAKDIQINFQTPPRFPPVQTDPQFIRIAIQNLLSNAIQYIGDKKGLVEINLKKKDNDFIQFLIKDNGIGIPQHQQQRVFEKFFRADNALRYKTVGTGLGLFISKAIIESSGGKIWFKSRQGVGTTFYFTLPIK